MKSTVFTNCRYCESNCALAVQVENNRVIKITPDKGTPHTWRDICAKGLTARDLVEHPRRIKEPMKRMGDRYVPVSYEEAVEEIGNKLKQLIDAYGPDSIGYYNGNPTGFTSSLFFALGCVDAIGTRSRYSVGSVDQNNNHVVSRRLFGLGFLPMAPDVENCDYFLLVGMDPAESRFSWLGSSPAGWQKALQAKKRGAELVVVDPRRTRSADRASRHLIITPGTDWAFILGLIKVVIERKLVRNTWFDLIDPDQYAVLEKFARGVDIMDLSEICGISAVDIKATAVGYGSAERGMCLTQTGVSMHDTGTLGHWLGVVLDLITGHLDQPGGRRWERGYVNITDSTREEPANKAPSRVRGIRPVEGMHMLAELADEIETPGKGQIKAFFLHRGNPVVSGPNGERLDKALKSLELLVAVDLVQRESHCHAHWLIPCYHWLEQEELHFILAGAQDVPVAQWSRRAVEPPATIHPEWKFFADLALKLKRPMFGRRGINTVIRLTRLLAKLLKKPDIAFSSVMIEKQMLKQNGQLDWKQLTESPHGFIYKEKQYNQIRGIINTADGKVHIAPEEFLQELQKRLDAPPELQFDYPFYLIGKRSLNMMNSWHMDLPNVKRRVQTNDCEINVDDARTLEIQTGDMVRVRSEVNHLELPATVTDKVPPGVIAIQHGWGSRVFDPTGEEPPWQAGVNRNLLVSDQTLDPFSGIPRLNSTAVSVEKVVHDNK
jgi:formate dehydrogenase